MFDRLDPEAKQKNLLPSHVTPPMWPSQGVWRGGPMRGLGSGHVTCGPMRGLTKFHTNTRTDEHRD